MGRGDTRGEEKGGRRLDGIGNGRGVRERRGNKETQEEKRK